MQTSAMPMLSPAARAALAVWLAQAPPPPECAETDNSALGVSLTRAAAMRAYQSQGEAALHHRLNSTTSGR